MQVSVLLAMQEDTRGVKEDNVAMKTVRHVQILGTDGPAY
jgi:hypothetical protein